MNGEKVTVVREPDLTSSPANSLQTVLLQNRKAILRFLSARMRGELDEVEDRFQDIWIKLGDIQPKSPIRDPISFVYRVADNVVLDARKMRVRREKRNEAWGQLASELDVAGPERKVAADAEIAQIEAVMAALSAKTLLVFQKSRLEGYSQKEIAKQLGISVSGVEKHLQRAYKRLAEFRSGKAARS